MTSYYELTSLSKTPGYPVKDWYEEAKRTWLCSGCSNPKPSIDALDAYLAYPPDDVPLNIISGVGIGYAQLRFVQHIKMNMLTDQFSFGKVFDPEGSEIPEYITFRSRNLLFIRGDSRSSFRQCGVCNRQLYHPIGKRHILSNDLIGSSIYESQIHQMVVDEQVFELVSRVKWRKMGSWKLPVW